MGFFSFRVAEFSSLKFQPAQNWHRLSQRHKLHPEVITVTAYKNGSRTVFTKVTVPTITLVNSVQKFSVLYFFPYSFYNLRNEKDDIYCVKIFFSVMNL